MPCGPLFLDKGHLENSDNPIGEGSEEEPGLLSSFDYCHIEDCPKILIDYIPSDKIRELEETASKDMRRSVSERPSTGRENSFFIKHTRGSSEFDIRYDKKPMVGGYQEGRFGSRLPTERRDPFGGERRDPRFMENIGCG